jgi:hypothetical protein
VELFLLTRLAIAFELFDNEQDAVSSFFPGRTVKRFDLLNFMRHRDDPNCNYGAGSAQAC